MVTATNVHLSDEVPGRRGYIRGGTHMRRFVILGVVMLAAASRVAAADVTIVDTLGVATPTTTFTIYGSWGAGILNTSYVGPQFTLAEPTTITEIGGCVNHSRPDAPLVVEIRPSTNGAPDPT